MLNRNAKTLKVYSARITTSKQLYFAKLARMGLLRISIYENVECFINIRLAPQFIVVNQRSMKK
jgi:hypothetical protein